MNNNKYIYLIDCSIIIVENDVSTNNHHHHAIKIAINLGELSKLVFNGNLLSKNTLIFDADKIHSFNSNSNPVLIFLVNPESSIGETIRMKYLHQNGFFISNFSYNSHIKNHFNQLLNTILPRPIVQDIHNDIIHALCGKSFHSLTLDRRIAEALKKIEIIEDKKLPVKELASQVFLSESRFAHLFKEETNIPVRQYLAWLRLLDALKLIIKGSSFTDAAMESGFTDLPHLHKTFTHFFGVKLSDYLNNSRFIQVLDYGSL